MNGGDVIAAIATAWGESAIAVLRLSGAGSAGIADGFFRGRRPLASVPPRYMALGLIEERPGRVVDQVLAVRFEAGKSYTGEESVEIHCHGGITAVQRCLELFLGAGARLAEPGEFTKRAFLSGRIDLAQAEAVLSVIRSKSDAALASSGRTLQGRLSAEIRALMDALTAFRASLEVRLDYPEEVDGQETDEIAEGVAAIAGRTRDLAERCRVGVMLSAGLKVAIIGRPNVGKSALLNALVGEERAIVTDVPGTTRDTVSAFAVWRGLAMEFVDTAGIRQPGDEVEELGIARSLKAMEGADVCVVVVDSSQRLTGFDRSAAGGVAKPALLALNKSDLPGAADESEALSIGRFERAVHTSALTGEGVAELKDAIFALAVGDSSLEEGFTATERMTAALNEASQCMDCAGEALKRSAAVDAAGALLAEAADIIARLLGEDATEDLLDAIFSTFCVGK
ncbi:MAG: tRNA uridine-5-carboxymethylaminomethyl(34) synthesis GTPase MnmE [Synergistaceae bacterium]|jgi:tRNA modification GTPase|nr:tRNA uridine-5-carboxymethylaminomethyl(34) synthesis GTPase MnmE [Synergistaceae bacterium]